MSSGIGVEPSVISWAITRAGYDLHSFSESFPNIQKWIKGKKNPSIFELERFSNYVDIPLGYLLLPAPLEEKLPVPFFKTDEGCVDWVNLNVYNLVLLMQGRQEWLRGYLKDNGIKAYPYVAKFNLNSSLEEIVDDIRNTLGLTEYWARSFPTWKQALEFLVDKLEEIGIVMAFSSSVKQDNFRSISASKCRGVVLIDSLAPYILINVSDAKAAQMLTIMYGVAHIWLGKSAGFDFMRLHPANDPLERLCYKVAAEFLAPEETFYVAWEKRRDVEKMTKLFRVSPVVVARRLVDMGQFSEFDFFGFYNNYVNQNSVRGEWTSSKGALYANKQRRMGKVFSQHVKQAVRTNKLLYKDAYKLSKMRGGVYRKLLDE